MVDRLRVMGRHLCRCVIVCMYKMMSSVLNFVPFDLPYSVAYLCASISLLSNGVCRRVDCAGATARGRYLTVAFYRYCCCCCQCIVCYHYYNYYCNYYLYLSDWHTLKFCYQFVRVVHVCVRHKTGFCNVWRVLLSMCVFLAAFSISSGRPVLLSLSLSVCAYPVVYMSLCLRRFAYSSVSVTLYI